MVACVQARRFYKMVSTNSSPTARSSNAPHDDTSVAHAIRFSRSGQLLVRRRDGRERGGRDSGRRSTHSSGAPRHRGAKQQKKGDFMEPSQGFSVELVKSRLTGLAPTADGLGFACTAGASGLRISGGLSAVSSLKHLSTVDLSDNRLSTLSGLEGLPQLAVLVCRGNRLQGVLDFRLHGRARASARPICAATPSPARLACRRRRRRPRTEERAALREWVWSAHAAGGAAARRESAAVATRPLRHSIPPHAHRQRESAHRYGRHGAAHLAHDARPKRKPARELRRAVVADQAAYAQLKRQPDHNNAEPLQALSSREHRPDG